MAQYRAATFAISTQRSYKCHLRSYIQVCEMMNMPPVPASQEFIAQYSAFLAHQLKPASVKQYLNIIRILHVEANMVNPLQDNWYVHTTLKGIERIKGTSVQRKVPMTPSILMQIKKLLDFSCLEDNMFWAACVLMFFATLRKSDLVSDSVKSYSGEKQFCRSDFVFCEDSVSVKVKYSKTIQFKERGYTVTLPRLAHPLCPVAALHKAFLLCPLPASAPAFVINSAGLPMTSSWLATKLGRVMRLAGYDPHLYTSHSFRRGSAVWALQCAVPGEIVKQMGDWKSNCYHQYLDQLLFSIHLHYRKIFGAKLP